MTHSQLKVAASLDACTDANEGICAFLLKSCHGLLGMIS